MMGSLPRPSTAPLAREPPSGTTDSKGAHDPDHGSTYYEHRKFREVVLGIGEVEVTLHDGLQAVRIGQTAERSAAEHRGVEL